MIRVYCIQTEAQNMSASRLDAKISGFADELPAAKRDRIRNIRPWQSRLNSAIGWRLLKFAFLDAGHTDFTLAQLLFDGGRKPRWRERGCDFNLSHSGALVACALTEGGQVGVDVEIIRPVQRSALLQRIRAPSENLPLDSDDAFFRFWTQKEAVLKAEGASGVWDMRHVRLEGLTARYKESRWYLYPLPLAAHYVAHAAGNIRDQSITIERVTIEQLLNAGDARDQAPQVV